MIAARRKPVSRERRPALHGRERKAMRQASLRFAIDRVTPPQLARAALARGPGLTGIDISYHLDGNFIAREKPAADVRLADGSIVTTIFINAFSCFNESPRARPRRANSSIVQRPAERRRLRMRSAKDIHALEDRRTCLGHRFHGARWMITCNTMLATPSKVPGRSRHAAYRFQK